MKAGNCAYQCPEDLAAIIPVFPLPGALLLPRAELPLNIFEPRYLAMIDAATPFRQCRVTAMPYQTDFAGCLRDDSVDRPSVLRTFRAYLDAHNLDTDWESVDSASNETLINALAMMAPFGCAEKQALLEAPDLRSRAETLVAITEMSLARDAGRSGTLQ